MGILLVFSQPIYIAADGNSREMAFPLHEPLVCISTTQSKPYLSFCYVFFTILFVLKSQLLLHHISLIH